MTDVVIKRLSELDRAHTPLLNDMLHIMRGDKDYHILYGDYVDAILPGLGVDEPKWNAGKLHNVPVVITNPNDKEYIVYNSASNSFINKQILYSDINYGTLGVVNGLEYLKVVSGNLTSSRILTTELQPSNVNAAGKYLRVSADGKSIYEESLIQETTISTSDITNLNTSQSGIGQITSATLNRPSGSVGFAFVAKQPNGNSAAMITVDTNSGETKVRTHNGGANQNSFTVYYDIYNSRTNPLSSEITSTSATSIANSLAVSTLNQKIETFITNSGNNSALLNTHKSSGDHDARYYTKTYIDATFPNFTNVSNAAILTTGKLDNNRLNDTITSNTSGNAATATKLKTQISLNGSNFDGSGNITTEIWGTSRTLTVGSTSKSVNGGSNVGWTLAEIGVPSTTGAGASGDWGINITGNAATATYATNAETAATVTYATSAGYAASADTATKLATARNINGIPFSGEADITIPVSAWPVGATYIQFPGQSSPSALFGGTWQQLFNTEGVFFRTEGGDASAFGDGIQSDALQEMTGSFRVPPSYNHTNFIKSADGVFSSERITMGGSRTDDDFGSSYQSVVHFNAANSVRTATETRPVNRTIRVWKRVE